MDRQYLKLIEEIKLNSTICGISSDDVNFAKSLVDNKCKDKDIFVCEGLWAVDKLIEKNFEVSHFFYNQEKLESDCGRFRVYQNRKNTQGKGGGDWGTVLEIFRARQQPFGRIFSRAGLRSVRTEYFGLRYLQDERRVGRFTALRRKQNQKTHFANRDEVYV